MKTESEAVQEENFIQRGLHSAPGRIVIMLMALLAGILAAYVLALLVAELFPPGSPIAALLEILIIIAASTGVYLGATRLFERRPLPVAELSLPGAGRELGAGLLVGAALALLATGGLWLLGVYRPGAWNGFGGLVLALVTVLPAGFLEELALRGVILRIGEERMGAFTALLVSALVPGLIHAAGDGSTPLGILSAALVSGALMGTAYLLTHRLWLPIGLHAAWDIVTSGVFGLGNLTTAPVTGDASARGLIQGTLSGPDLLTGGVAGFEASVVTLVIAAAACVGLYLLAEKRQPELFED